MKSKIFLISLFVLSILIIGCTTTPVADDSKATPEGVTQVVGANNQFTFELYSKLSEREGNVFFSPYSISSALAMTYEGTVGETAEQIRDVFHFPEDDTLRRTNMAAVINGINAPGKEYKLHTANALWVQDEYPLKEDYKSVVEKYYLGKATNLDFAGETEKSRQIINKWVEDKTNNRIKDLILPGAISGLTRLVLTNAVYFKGKWLLEFDEKDTYTADFHVSEEKVVRADMMRRTDKDAEFYYAEDEDVQVLEMQYKGEELSMLVFLPKDNIKALEAKLTLENIETWKSQLSEQRVNVYFPKFTFETKYELTDTLKDMGMSKAFAPSFDFSGMSGVEQLFISKILHKAFVEVNEEGTEAAAATAVIIEAEATGMPPPIPIFQADHPFIFIIQERDTGNILFMGRVMDPTA